MRRGLTVLLSAASLSCYASLEAQAPDDGARATRHAIPQVIETAHYRIEPEPGIVNGAPESTEFIEALVSIYSYVGGRLGLSLKEQIVVEFVAPDTSACPIRGIAYRVLEASVEVQWPGAANSISVPSPRVPKVVIFANADTTRAQLLGVLAHETAHAILLNKEDEPLAGSLALNEGLASWAAGEYWLRWQGFASWDAAIKSYLAAGTYLPLDDNERPVSFGNEDPPASSPLECLARRDVFYTKWAAFIDYLVERHGMERLLDLVRSSRLVLGPETSYFVNYSVVYGRTLRELEAEWLAKVRASD